MRRFVMDAMNLSEWYVLRFFFFSIFDEPLQRFIDELKSDETSLNCFSWNEFLLEIGIYGLERMLVFRWSYFDKN